MSLYKVRKAISSAVSAMEFSGQTDPTTPLTYAACSILVFTLRFHTCPFQGSIKPIVFAVRKQVLWFIRESIKLGSVTSYIDYFSQEFARMSPLSTPRYEYKGACFLLSLSNKLSFCIVGQQSCKYSCIYFPL